MIVRDMAVPTVSGEKSSRLLTAIRSAEPVAGYTHTFYRYPARFSPHFAREAIQAFSSPGDVVLDPFMGGGTSLVEAKALGRRGVGSDVSSLAVFLSKTKTAILTDSDRREIVQWASSITLGPLNLRNPAIRDLEWIDAGYLRNIASHSTWAIRKTVDLALGELASLRDERHKMFARCIILRTAQWALDCRKAVPSADQFRTKFLVFVNDMVSGSAAFERACKRWTNNIEELCLHQSSVTLGTTYHQIGLPPPRLVLTSPPYPGVHVVYHRWQVLGRRETPAPFWIAGTKDGAGASFYTFGDRHEQGLTTYFETASDVFNGIATISDRNTIVAQLLAFSDRRSQLQRYLEVMRKAGFEEINAGELSDIPGRTWRSVPNRKWYASNLGKTAASSEVVLFHRLARNK
jgi:hypothetical protein